MKQCRHRPLVVPWVWMAWLCSRSFQMAWGKLSSSHPWQTFWFGVVHEWHWSLPRSEIDHNVHVGKWELILSVCYVKISIINTNPQIPIWTVFFFFTRTMFANQRGCLMGLMNLEARSFSTSTLILASISKWKFLLYCTTSLVPGWIFSEWHIRLGLRLNISS